MYQNQLAPEKVELNTNWLIQKLPFEIKYKSNLEKSYAIQKFNTPYDNVDKWGANLLKFLRYKPNDLLSKLLTYGIELSKEILDLHNLQCNSNTCGYTTTYDDKVNFSESLLDRIKIEEGQKNPHPTIKNKIQWKGTQKQLAELFIELEKNGWIEKIEANTIKSCFTKSNTIQQPLKPITNPKTYEKTYDQVYTSQYSPSFYGIKENTKPSK